MHRRVLKRKILLILNLINILSEFVLGLIAQFGLFFFTASVGFAG